MHAVRISPGATLRRRTDRVVMSPV